VADGDDGGADGDGLGCGGGGAGGGAATVLTGVVGADPWKAAQAPTAVPAMAASEMSAHRAERRRGFAHTTTRPTMRTGIPTAKPNTTLSLEMMPMATAARLPGGVARGDE
jgi:hypothetical protein